MADFAQFNRNLVFIFGFLNLFVSFFRSSSSSSFLLLLRRQFLTETVIPLCLVTGQLVTGRLRWLVTVSSHNN